MGFDVLYLPPIHPIGRRFARERTTRRRPARRAGSPWAIGASEGGHKAILRRAWARWPIFAGWWRQRRRTAWKSRWIIAFQCSPDHPYVTEHPDWFRQRPDGTIQYAENPPKKYQDIYPFDFESNAWQALWEELKSSSCWIGEGVRIFRVDNPHTKAFPFWEWCIGRSQAALSRRAVSVRSLYAAEADVPAGEAWIQPVVHVFHLAEQQAGVDRIFAGS